MKKLSHIGLVGGVFLGGIAWVTIALANPALIPDHPGHPMKAMKDPVNGQSLANDPGRSLWTGEQALKESTKLKNRRVPEFNEKDTNVNYQGAGVLPELKKGYPDYKIAPPVSEATRLNN